MRQNLSRNPLVFGTVLLSFAWNILLLVGVILNLGFSHTRAAGGQFTDFPASIRVVYVLQLVLVVYQVWIFKQIFHTEPIRLKWLPKFFVIVGILGILANAASRSSNERWNVIPAAIITWSFWYYGVKKKKSGLQGDASSNSLSDNQSARPTTYL
jgi:hypothetical protein